MGAIARLHFFRLAEDGVRCDESGCFVGGVALLRRSPASANWTARSLDELDEDLSALYGLPIDSAAKRGGLAVVAGALQRSEMALAKIAALLLRFPDPPALGKDRGTSDLAERLLESGLLKGVWDEAQHPRTGAAPNRGWFALKPKRPEPPSRGWPSRLINIVIRSGILEWVLLAAELNPEVRTAATILDLTIEAMKWLRTEFPEENLDSAAVRTQDQIYANLQPPKTLDELETQPPDHLLGYELHHIVEQNPANVAKGGPAELDWLRKFGQDALDHPSNLAYVPRLKHELITAYYNSHYLDRRVYPRTREVVSAMDFNDQREAGLAALRYFGVLK
jgi:hypothetical protein